MTSPFYALIPEADSAPAPDVETDESVADLTTPGLLSAQLLAMLTTDATDLPADMGNTEPIQPWLEA